MSAVHGFAFLGAAGYFEFKRRGERRPMVSGNPALYYVSFLLKPVVTGWSIEGRHDVVFVHNYTLTVPVDALAQLRITRVA